ncbi:RhoGAP domain containing protein [Entamoeba histolytica HM-1:IMSS-A]|uniref:RhoGAP domain containing protein n=1 Tax=Entamoeba histolytica HM-1:IMSS-A TaxID=885318 RepID=N9UZD8_ENTH1|nr:RhoGAP domain containing protein [Entamoeba histolytica HM-1:IMSS-A]
MNKLYGKSTPSTPRSLKSPRKKFSSPELQEELLKYMEKYRMIGDNFVWLSGLLSTFQIKFSDYSQKKLIRLYISIFSADPSITDGVSVLLSYDTSNKKSRSIQLIKNFLFIGKEETKEIDHVIYLTKPRLILINETTISFDNITIDFKDRDVCVKWIDDLTNLQPCWWR